MIRSTDLRMRSQLAAHALWDQLVRPSATLASDVPWCAEAITPDWITAALAQGRSAQVERITITGGDSGSSVRRAISIDWNDAGNAAGLATRLFAKTTPTLATRLSAGMVAPTEGRFLTQVRPRLSIEAPVCLHTARDRLSGRSIHLFEDLTVTQGAKFFRIHDEINRQQAEGIVDTLADLHGTFWAPAEGRPTMADVAWLNTFEDFFNGGVHIGIEAFHELAMTRAAAVIPSAVMARRAEVWPATVRAAAASQTGTVTVIHSDVHLGNWYVTNDDRIGLSDWARVCRGHGTRDVAYSLMTTLTVENRRAWQDALLQRYRERLRTGFGIGMGMDELMRGYRQQAFSALMMWTPTLCPPPLLPEMQSEATSMEMIKRITTAIDDMHSLDSFN